MELRDERELEVTREKLRLLEEHYEARRHEPTQDPYVRELSLWSIKRMINQMKEEIARYEAHKAAAASQH
jgi:hypothetical protein